MMVGEYGEEEMKMRSAKSSPRRTCWLLATWAFLIKKIIMKAHPHWGIFLIV